MGAGVWTLSRGLQAGGREGPRAEPATHTFSIKSSIKAGPGEGRGVEGVPLEDSTARVEVIQHTFTKRLLHDSSGEDLPGVGCEVTVGGRGCPGRGQWAEEERRAPTHSVCVCVCV